MPTAGFNIQFLITGSELDNWNINISWKNCEIKFSVNNLIKRLKLLPFEDDCDVVAYS